VDQVIRYVGLQEECHRRAEMLLPKNTATPKTMPWRGPVKWLVCRLEKATLYFENLSNIISPKNRPYSP
jgi:hypothetical protein